MASPLMRIFHLFLPLAFFKKRWYTTPEAQLIKYWKSNVCCSLQLNFLSPPSFSKHHPTEHQSNESQTLIRHWILKGNIGSASDNKRWRSRLLCFHIHSKQWSTLNKQLVLYLGPYFSQVFRGLISTCGINKYSLLVVIFPKSTNVFHLLYFPSSDIL